jgi:hypothetical protein
MKLEFICTNDNCRQNTRPFVYEMDCEAVMDERNLASVFCPHCQHPLSLKNRRQ